MMKRVYCNLAAILMLLLIVILSTACSAENQQSKAIHDALAEDVKFELFQETYGEKELLTYLYGDFNEDGVEDLIIVYKESANASYLVTVFSAEGSYLLTEPISAPVDSCQLEWKDVDNRPPKELLVSGQKGIHYGYGVFHFIDNQWQSLYGEMDQCC